jgi:hypothetical protein
MTKIDLFLTYSRNINLVLEMRNYKRRNNRNMRKEKKRRRKRRKKKKERMEKKKQWSTIHTTYFDIPVGTTRITEDSWVEWSVNHAILTDVTVPDSVTVIEKEAFSYCLSLTAVTLPKLVTIIHRGAFFNCYSLTEVTIPISVTVIDEYAFGECNSLTVVTIPKSVTVIKGHAFGGCRSLEKVTIPSSVTELADDAFFNCLALRAVDFGRVADLAAPNRFPELNRIARTATVEHPLKNGDSCVVRRTWPASTTEFETQTYAGTEPDPPTEVVDAAGIVSPIPLQDLGGNTYPVHGCWAADHPTADFKALAAAQHPEALGDPASWAVLLPNAEVAVDTLDLAQVASMIARGELSLADPWLLVWTHMEGH